jgi:hypothetical protein
LGDNDLMTVVLIGGAALLAWKVGLFDKLGSVLKPGTGGTSTGDTSGDGTDTSGGDSGGISNADAVKFSAAGDWGSGRNTNWQKTVAEMAKFKPDVVLIPGDTAYTGGSAKFKPVVDAIKKFASKVLGAKGNHDSGDDSLFDAYSNSVTNIGNTSFMSLDANSTGSAITFAKANFTKMTGKWKVVFFHQPAKSPKSTHAVTMQAIIPELEKAKINVVIQAHNHLYARYTPVAGVNYFVCGTGGESHYSGSGGAAKVDDTTFGTTNFTTSANDIKGQYVANGGAVVDSFTILAGTASAYARAYNARASYGRLRPRIVA